MKKIIIISILAQLSLIQHDQIILDHSIVDDFDKIPASYMAKVREMMIYMAEGYPING